MLQRLEESQNLAGKVTGPIVMKLHHGDKPLTPEGGPANAIRLLSSHMYIQAALG